MKIKSLELEHFRNYREQVLLLHPGMNVLFGRNAQGKTNLLEACAYLSTTRSYRTREARNLITFGETHGRVAAKVQSQANPVTVEIQLFTEGRRQFLLNGIKTKTAAALIGAVRTVLFCPEDLRLIRDASSARRRFLDQSLCQLRPRYAAALAEYHRLYTHKTRILRDFKEKPSLLHALEEFNLRMAQVGAILIRYRARYIQGLAGQAEAAYQECTGKGEHLAIQYETVSGVADPFAPAEEITGQILEQMALRARPELESRSCLFGPHKDDILILIDGKPAKNFASQGQARTAALALKLAERELHFHDLGTYPVLLLDDILSELDAVRQEYVLNRISGGQVVITCCEDERLRRLKEGKVFYVAGGRITG